MFILNLYVLTIGLKTATNTYYIYYLNIVFFFQSGTWVPLLFHSIYTKDHGVYNYSKPVPWFLCLNCLFSHQPLNRNTVDRKIECCVMSSHDKHRDRHTVRPMSHTTVK